MAVKRLNVTVDPELLEEFYSYADKLREFIKEENL